VIFSQDFSSAPDGPVATYANATTPDSGQWNTISTSGAGVAVSVSAGSLQFDRATANSGSFTRTTDFSPTPVLVVYKFDLSVSGNTVAQTSAAVWQMGSGFNQNANSAEVNANVHSRFGINFTATDGTFQFRDIGGSANSGNFSGLQSVMWIINNSGASASYMAPDSSVQSIGDDKWELWAGTTQVFDERNATTIGQVLTDLKFAYESGTGRIIMDNFEIQAVPEPVHVGLYGAVGLLGISGLQIWRDRKRKHRLLAGRSL
jgi:hypothetical protein